MIIIDMFGPVCDNTYIPEQNVYTTTESCPVIMFPCMWIAIRIIGTIMQVHYVNVMTHVTALKGDNLARGHWRLLHRHVYGKLKSHILSNSEHEWK